MKAQELPINYNRRETKLMVSPPEGKQISLKRSSKLLASMGLGDLMLDT